LKELETRELREINGGGMGLIVLACLVVAALVFYNGKKDTDLQYKR